MARLSLLLFALFCSSNAFAGVRVWLATDRDDLGARIDCEKRDDVAKRQVMLERLERKLLAAMASRDELVAKYGEAVSFDVSELVRPLGAPLVVVPENVRPDEINGLMDRASFFELNRSTGILVFLSPEGKPYNPPILFWKIDDDLPKMTDAALCEKRLEWERPLLDAVLRLAGASESDLAPTDEEVQRRRDASVRVQQRINELRRTKP